MNLCRVVVSPILRTFAKGARGGADLGQLQQAGDPGEFVATAVTDADIVLGDPIVGSHGGSDYPTVVRTRVIQKDVSAEEFATHCATHIPMGPACIDCAAATRPNDQHRCSPGGRRIPRLASDDGFLTKQSTNESVPYLVVYVLPWRVVFTSVADVKGPYPSNIKRLAQRIQDCGRTHFVYRSDREIAIRKMPSQAVKLAGVKAGELKQRILIQNVSPRCKRNHTLANPPAMDSQSVRPRRSPNRRGV